METQDRVNNEGVEILVVEDSPTQAEQLRFLLEEQHHTVEVAANGKEALEAVRQRKPRLVITDVVMPEMDGYALCTAIKSDPVLKDIPVVIVTALSGIQDIAKSLECGADNFIRKPYDPKMLLARIEYILLNLELRASGKIRVGLEVYLGGKKHFITSEREQILDLLISTYAEAVHMNEELQVRQREIARSNQTLRGLYRIAEGLNRVSTEAEVCEMALQGAMELPTFRAGWILLRDSACGFRTVAACNVPAALQGLGAMAGDCRCLRLLQGGEVPHGTSVLDCERLQRLAGGDAGLHEHASTPLWVGDRCLGVMNIVGAEPGAFGEEGTRILDAVGSQVAVALERARLYEHLETLVEQRTAALQAEVVERRRAEARVAGLNRIHAVLSGINSAIVRVRERDELCKEACRIAVELGKFRLAWIGLVEADGSSLRPVACLSAEEDDAESAASFAADIMAESQAVIGRVVRNQKSAVFNDTASAADDAFARAALARGYRSAVVLPLLVGGSAAGVLGLYAAERGVFDEGELKLLEELAGDISFALEYIEKEERINYLAYYDALTGLPNRSLFYDRLNQLLQADRHGAGLVAVLAIELERFKSINNTFGRHVGDALLKLVAGRLVATMGSTDRLARIGADHFAGILVDVPDEAAVAHLWDDQIAQSMRRPFIVDERELRLSVKVGIALSPGDGSDADTLFTNAEIALGKAKAAGERYLFYAPQMNARACEKLTLENKLRRALENDEFVLYYQPKLDLKSGTITGLEALMRWNDPDSGLVLPHEFIPILEETGMIVEVGRWALEKAVSDHEAWRAKGLHPPRIAVNVSAVQLRRKDFLRTVEHALALQQNGMHPLDLEITESLVMEDIEENIDRLRTIREMGVGVAIDDFGTGYSSLSYIAKLPVDALKIDRAFIVDMVTSPDDATIVFSIISLAHALNFRVIAEGVETEEQSKMLKLLKCDEVQGYIFTPPVPPGTIEAMLSGRAVQVGG